MDRKNFLTRLGLGFLIGPAIVKEVLEKEVEPKSGWVVPTRGDRLTREPELGIKYMHNGEWVPDLGELTKEQVYGHYEEEFVHNTDFTKLREGDLVMLPDMKTYVVTVKRTTIALIDSTGNPFDSGQKFLRKGDLFVQAGVSRKDNL